MRQLLRAGLADVLDLDLMPVLLGGGLRFFDALGPQPILLERIDVVALTSGRTHLRYRVVK